MSYKSLLILGTCAAFASYTTPVAAIPVFDASNYAQNMLSAARALQQINNQIQSLNNEAQLLLQGARNLTSLDLSVVRDLRANLAHSRALIDAARGLTFDVAGLDTRFRTLYPDSAPPDATGAALAAAAQARWLASLEALRTTIHIQAEVAGAIAEDERLLAGITGKSEAAVGLLQATQATNQLLALQAKQAMQSQLLALAAARATASEAARALAADERARAVRSHFRGTGAYTPAPVRVFEGGE